MSEHRAAALDRAREFILRRGWEVAFWTAGTLLAVWVAWDAFSFRIVTQSSGADYWEHAAALRALLEDPWHPENPQVISPAPSPRFGPHYLLVALMGRALGVDSLGALGIASVLNTLLFLGGIFLFFRRYFGEPRAAFYGLIVAFASWWDTWHFSNVYQLEIYFSVASYPSSAALGLTLIAFWLALRVLRAPHNSRWGLVGLVLLSSVLLLTHPLTAILGLSGLGLLALTEPGVGRNRRFWVLGAVAIGCLLAAVWPYYPVYRVMAGGRGEEAGWAMSLLDRSAGKLHHFYQPRALFQSLGLSVVGVLLVPYFLYRRKNLWFALGALSMGLPFAVNALVPLPLGHRFILLAIPYLQMAVVWLLLRLSPGSRHADPRVEPRRQLAGLLVGATLALFAFHNVRSAVERFHRISQGRHAPESDVVRYARRAAELTGPGALILAGERDAWPLPAFGPRVISLLHENPLVEGPFERRAAVDRFFDGHVKDDERSQILTKYRVTHVLAKRVRSNRVRRFLSRHSTRKNLPGGYELYELASSTPGT